MISRRKAIAFSLVPVSLLLLLLVLTEAGLRLFAPSLSSPLLLETTYDGEQWYQVNRRYLEKYFPSRNVLVPEFKPTLIRKERTPRLFRVLCLGESSMFGTPYQMTATIPALLRKQLSHAMPEKEVEVVNLGAAAINTNVIVGFAPQLLVLKPDVVVIYTGHNEFYGPEGVGASFLEKQFPFLSTLKYQIRSLRLVALAQKLLDALIGRAERTGEQNMMRQVSNNAHVALASEDARRVLRRFEDNLAALILIFRKEGIPVIVSDISSNLMFPPFAYEERQNFPAIRSAAASGNYQTVLRLLDRQNSADSLNAFIAYWRGRSLLAAGDSAAARHLLERARDEDLLKFRAPGAISAAIHRISGEERVPCIAMDSLLSALSPRGITDSLLFWEHLHPRVEGYYQIATAFFRELCAQRLLPVPDPAAAYARRLPWQPDSLSVCWLDRAYADLSMRGLTGKWPFTDYHVRAVVLDGADATLRRIATEVYTRKILWNEGCLQTASHFETCGDMRNARTTYEAMIDEYPHSYYTHYLLGNVLRRIGELDGAQAAYERSIHCKADYPYPHVDLGLLLINEGRLDEAAAHMNDAIALAGNDPATASLRSSAYYGLSAIAANRGNFRQALGYVDQALRLSPRYEPARALRERLMTQH